ncbi:hypothetical protein Godav_004944 [Gossypium davidsonii]|uniref:RNase H type-1 domain-containing protein n=1 Tax=Gossypium davidsonii TaxID=34287 RepID=A0A7J8SNP0_GOSDV|nr:hypothetical protein [Gossypium davidsonii]
MSGFLSSCGNKASIGGVIRDCGGDWVVGFTMDVSATPIFQVQAKALYEGMRFAWDEGFELESDNGLIVELIRDCYGERNELIGSGQLNRLVISDTPPVAVVSLPGPDSSLLC